MLVFFSGFRISDVSTFQIEMSNICLYTVMLLITPSLFSSLLFRNTKSFGDKFLVDKKWINLFLDLIVYSGRPRKRSTKRYAFRSLSVFLLNLLVIFWALLILGRSLIRWLPLVVRE